MIEVELRVGMIDPSLALAQLLTSDHQVLTLPSTLLPSDAKGGSIVRLQCALDTAAQDADTKAFEATQDAILSQLTRAPSTPHLKVHNFTQTSAVLTWDQIDPGSADLLTLALHKNGERLGLVTNPLSRVSTKLENLEIDTKYQFELVLSTSAGTLRSNTVEVHTHKMTDLSGLTVCLGSLEGSQFSRADMEKTLERIGCRPVQSEVKLDTTHFVCTVADGPQCHAAQIRSVPIVRPEWLKACESERRLVEVRQYYLSEDVRLVAPHRPRAGSVATAATGDDPMVAGASRAVTPDGAEGAESVARSAAPSVASSAALSTAGTPQSAESETNPSRESTPAASVPEITVSEEPEEPQAPEQAAKEVPEEAEEAPEGGESELTESSEPTEPIETTEPQVETEPLPSDPPAPAEPASTEPTEPSTEAAKSTAEPAEPQDETESTPIEEPAEATPEATPEPSAAEGTPEPGAKEATPEGSSPSKKSKKKRGKKK